MKSSNSISQLSSISIVFFSLCFNTVEETDIPAHVSCGNRLRRPKHCPAQAYKICSGCFDDAKGKVCIGSNTHQFALVINILQAPVSSFVELGKKIEKLLSGRDSLMMEGWSAL